MDSEPFVPTPEKAGAENAQTETVSAFKRILFAAPNDWKNPKDEHSNKECSRSKQSSNAWRVQSDFEFDHSKKEEGSRDIADCSKGRSSVDQASTLQVDASYCSPRQKLGTNGRAEERHYRAGVQQSKQSHEQESTAEVSSSTACPPSEPKTAALHTPLKAKRPGVTYGLFTPPAAPAARRPVASSPVTPLPNATAEASGRRAPNKNSAKLKGLSLQLESAGQDAPASSSSPIQEVASSKTPTTSLNSDASLHPYALLASSHPAEELMGDPKYRGMAALGCQHQYTEADRASFLRRREIIARDLNSAFA